jgi:magnesium transporter
MLGKVFQTDIQDLIEEKNFASIKDLVSELDPADIAEMMEDLEEREEAMVFRLLPRDRAAHVFEHLPVENQESLIQRLSSETVKHLLNEMSPDDRTSLLEELPAEVAQGLMRILSPEQRRIASTLLGYPEDSVGRLMTPEFVAIREKWTVLETLEFLRKKGEDRETLDILYVVNEKGKLQDEITLRQAVLAEPSQTIADLMDRQISFLRVTEDQEEAIEQFMKYDRVAMPVVDSTHRLVGIVTVDDVMDVAEEEATEDIQLMAAVQTLEDPYFETGYVTMFQKRALWLFVLFLAQMLTVTALERFKVARADVFEKLSVFLVLMISTGGNSGSQASSLVIRGLAVKEIEIGHWWRVVFREVGMGLSLGVFLGALGAARALLTGGDWFTPLTVGAALIGIVTFGTFFGSMLPFVLKRIGFDPAVSSGPFVATFADVTGILILYITAVLVIGLLT